MDILFILAIHHPFSHLFKITQILFEDSSSPHSLVMWSGWQSGPRSNSASHSPALEVCLSLRIPGLGQECWLKDCHSLALYWTWKDGVLGTAANHLVTMKGKSVCGWRQYRGSRTRMGGKRTGPWRHLLSTYTLKPYQLWIVQLDEIIHIFGFTLFEPGFFSLQQQQQKNDSLSGLDARLARFPIVCNKHLECFE